MPTMIARSLLATLALLLTGSAFFVTLWIILPGPVYRLFQLSTGASELSLWLTLLAVIGVALSMATLRLGGKLTGGIALILGAIAVVISLVPAVQARNVASHEGVSLSLRQYFFGRSVAGVEITRDIPFATIGGQRLALDIYRPSVRPTTAAPAVVVVHGGSWSGGSHGEVAWMSQVMAAAGMVVFDVDYRLAAPNQRFPVQVADVKCAIGWVRSNALRYGVDADRIALLGRSAGAEIALVSAYTPQDPALPPSCSVPDTSVRAVVSFYGPTDLLWGYDHPSPQRRVVDSSATLETYLGGTPATLEEAYRRASPVADVTPDAPPTLIFHGDHDQYVMSEHAHFLDAALERANVPHQTVILPWANHGFDFVPNGWGAQITEPLVLRFLDTYLKSSGAVHLPAEQSTTVGMVR